MKKEITIYDLATELNVSPSTVSRALKDHYSIGLATKRKVIQLAAEKGYRRDHVKKLCSIGVIVPDINQPLISSMISGIENAGNEGGFSVIIAQSLDEVKNEVKAVKSLSLAGVSGLIIWPANESKNADHLYEFKRRNIPVVFVDSVLTGFTADHVVIDYFEAAYQVTSHLLHQGCRRIAFMGKTLVDSLHTEKLRGYIRALRAHKIPVDEKLIATNEKKSGVKEAAFCAENLLDLRQPPDAIFCDNDMMAAGVIQYAKKRGLRVPHNLAVVGFNDDPFSQIIDPPLSTIAYPAVEVGKTAARVLAQRDTLEVPPRKITLKANLIVRQSSLRKQVDRVVDLQSHQ